MRKYIVGFLAGVLVATAGAAAADNISLVGKKIQSEADVTLDGHVIDKAVIVDGKSYAPIRSVADAVGVDVGYEKGVVKLETQAKQMPLSYWESRLTSLNEYLESTKKLVEISAGRVEKGQAALQKWQEILSSISAEDKDSIATYETRIANGKQEQAELETELAERQARVSEIEAEIALVKSEIAKLTE